jgi:hydrogenase maturation protease
MLVLGIGNPGREDDGVGWAVAEKIRRLDLPDVEVVSAVQLTPEMAADWARRRRVVVVDATLEGDAFLLRRLDEAGFGSEPGMSHATTVQTIVRLAGSLFERQPEVWLGSVRGASFGWHEGLSAVAAERAERLAEELEVWLRNTAAGRVGEVGD